jgi:dipeptidase E
MKFYLSSYKLGNEVEKLKALTANSNKKVAYIPNALDYSTDSERRKQSEINDITSLSELGFSLELIDLRQYFGKEEELKNKISEFDIFWVRGGNTFVLRQAMKLSGFDDLIKELYTSNSDKVYAGYSAGICILTKINLKLSGRDLGF